MSTRNACSLVSVDVSLHTDIVLSLLGLTRLVGGDNHVHSYVWARADKPERLVVETSIYGPAQVYFDEEVNDWDEHAPTLATVIYVLDQDEIVHYERAKGGVSTIDRAWELFDETFRPQSSVHIIHGRSVPAAVSADISRARRIVGDERYAQFAKRAARRRLRRTGKRLERHYDYDDLVEDFRPTTGWDIA